MDNGAEGIVATPSIGEFLHLSESERLRAWEITLEETRKRPGICAVAMTSGATTLETLSYARHAAKMGFDAQQVIPPYYWRCGELEVERHYRMVAEAGDLPVVIYHNPALSKFTISPKFAGRLAAIPNVVAMKEVLTDLQHLEALYDEIGGAHRNLQYVSCAVGGSDAGCGRRFYKHLCGACGGGPDEVLQVRRN